METSASSEARSAPSSYSTAGAGIVVGESVPADSRIPLDPRLFTLQRIAELGK